MKLRTIALDDEPLALKKVTDFIQKTPFLELAGEFYNPLEAIEFLENEKIDLIFLDIQMPDLTGVEFARVMQSGPKIIFTTAYENYALEGFRLNAVDYLLKPFNYEDFFNAAQKARKLIEVTDEPLPTLEIGNQFLFLKSEYKIRRINYNDILYIEGLDDYVKVYLYNEEKPIMSLNTLKSLEKKLPENRFMRVHRSYIINLEKIEIIERGQVVFGKTHIPVSNQHKEKFQNFINENFL